MTVDIQNKEQFDSFIQNGVTIVDFWAEWCGPCRMLAPEIEKIGEELGDKIKVAKVNVDDNQELATEYQIRSIPSVFIFKDGEAKINLVGINPKDTYIAKINELLGE